ncbi:hypothetical protein MRX96_024530 [Rhipicephalus microplus]
MGDRERRNPAAAPPLLACSVPPSLFKKRRPFRRARGKFHFAPAKWPNLGARGRGKRAIDGDASAAPRCGCRQQAPTISNAEGKGAESERDEAAISYATRRQRPEIMIAARSQITGEWRWLAARNGPDGLLIRVAAGGRQITLPRASRQLGAAHAEERAIRSPACACPVIWRRVPHCAARKKAPSATQIALAIDPPTAPRLGKPLLLLLLRRRIFLARATARSTICKSFRNVQFDFCVSCDDGRRKVEGLARPQGYVAQSRHTMVTGKGMKKKNRIRPIRLRVSWRALKKRMF